MAVSDASGEDAPLQHLAIIMDGNGRWAKARGKTRTAGHKAGSEAVKKSLRFCLENNIPHLTLFAFSSENWSRPKAEVKTLMELFLNALQKETSELHEHGVKLRFIGNLGAFSSKLREKMTETEQLTQGNTKLELNIAVNYGGRWDILQACEKIVREQCGKNAQKEAMISEAMFSEALSTNGTPDPDLLVRSSGEQRISNFLLWQLAYSELYFTDTLWPDMDESELAKAVDFYNSRQRRYGGLSDGKQHA